MHKNEIPDLNVSAGKKILFANFPADGHFNPLTGLAIYLKGLGYDVRWYSSKTYTSKLKELDIRHYPFKKALDVEGNRFDEAFPERKKKRSQLSKLKFDMIHAFILRGPEYYADILEIYNNFPFDLMIADCAFTGVPFVKEKMNIPVISIGVLPLTETSKDLAPPGLGISPQKGFWGRTKQAVLRYLANEILFKEPNQVMSNILDRFNIPHNNESIFDLLIKKSTLLLQSGTPGFEYKRSDLGQNIRFLGALLPHRSKVQAQPWFSDKLNRYEKVILVTQGTVETDVTKIIEPTLEAFKNSSYLVVATTGGSQTMELRKKYPRENFIIEDFIPFDDVMPYADAYITNGGYGGVMLGIEHELPLIVAGVHEGKNEINARVGYFNLGINLKTERPTPRQIKEGVERVLSNPIYKENITELSQEFRNYDPNLLTADYVADILSDRIRFTHWSKQREAIY